MALKKTIFSEAERKKKIFFHDIAETKKMTTRVKLTNPYLQPRRSTCQM